MQLCPWFFGESLSQSSCPSAATAAAEGAAAACGAPVLPPGWGNEEEEEEEEERDMLDMLLAGLEADPNFLGCATDPGHLLSPHLRMP